MHRVFSDTTGLTIHDYIKRRQLTEAARQLVNPGHLHTLEDLRALYPEAESVALNKSYRPTYEIITFAKGTQPVPEPEPVNRHGEKPSVISCQNQEEQLRNLKYAIETFQAGRNAALGIIVKTNNMAKALYQALSAECDINLLTPESSRFQNGGTVTSVRMAKGLEFGEVVGCES